MSPRLRDFPRGLYGMVDVPGGLAGGPSVVLSGALASGPSGAPADGPSGASAGGVAAAKRGPRGPAFAASLARSLLAGGAGVLQLRMKDATAAALLSGIGEVRAAMRPFPQALLIVNDRIDVALASGAAGVHLGQGDLPLSQARRIAPAGFIIGVSTHDERQAADAIAGGADYIAFGPVYPTTSKDNPDPVVGAQRLAAVCRLGRASSVPVVAIGGISLDRVPEVVAAGATAAAIIAAVNWAADVQAAAAQVTRCFAEQAG